MEIKISSVQIDNQAISPALTIGADLEFGYNINAPVSITGRLLSADNKVLSLLNEFHVNKDSSFGLSVLSQAEKDRIYREKEKKHYYVQLTAVLSHKAIEYIETQREKDKEKSVQFSMSFVIKYLDMPVDPQKIIGDDLVRLNVANPSARFEIKQSDWVKNYAPKLGIGNFMLLELRIPEEKVISAFWRELYERLTHNVKYMESSIRSGDWQNTMWGVRKFFEDIKIGDGKPGHKEFKEEFNKLMIKDQHSEEGIKNLYDAIWYFFEFASKYSHDKDKVGNLNPLPVSTKEDAYFAYALAVGLLNLIGRKINRD